MRSEIPSAGAAAVLALVASLAHAANADWPTYNRTLTSDRYAALETIDNKNVIGLKVLCTFDTGEQVSFQTGLVQVDGALFATTERDTFSIDPNNCKQNWRSHEDSPSGDLKVNRGLAWLDHRVFRGTADGKVIAYDAKNGKRLWATVIADASKGESVPAAPIAWDGLVFIGNAGALGLACRQGCSRLCGRHRRAYQCRYCGTCKLLGTRQARGLRKGGYAAA